MCMNVLMDIFNNTKVSFHLLCSYYYVYTISYIVYCIDDVIKRHSKHEMLFFSVFLVFYCDQITCCKLKKTKVKWKMLWVKVLLKMLILKLFPEASIIIWLICMASNINLLSSLSKIRLITYFNEIFLKWC